VTPVGVRELATTFGIEGAPPMDGHDGRVGSLSGGRVSAIAVESASPRTEVVARRATTGLLPTTLPSFNSRQSGYGCVFMSPRPS
jgi:hypothetical protein